MREILEAFLAERKAELIKKKTKDKPEKYNIKPWLEAAQKNHSSSVATHPSTFTHPDAKASPVKFYGEKSNDGLLRTGNVTIAEFPYDVFGNGASDSKIAEFYLFLQQKIEQEKTVFEHFKAQTADSQELIQNMALDYVTIREKFLKIFEVSKNSKSSKLLKQVYFPLSIEGKEYHLLSLLSSSVIMAEIKRRIEKNRSHESTKNAREMEKKNQFCENGFDDFYNITLIRFGGEKSQNISVINSKNRGWFYLMPSVPPVLEKRKIHLPRYSFFENTLYLKEFEDDFYILHKFLKMDRNNKNIRESIVNTVRFIFDKICHKAFIIRNSEPSHWSQRKNYEALPLSQKIWLDNKYLTERETTTHWSRDIVKDISRWILISYKKYLKNESVKWGDEELHTIERFIEKFIKEDREFLK